NTADRRRELARPRGRLAQPEGNRGRGATRVRDAHDAGLDAQDAPGGVSKLEDVPAVRLDGEVLVQRADEGAIGLDDHAILAGVGDRAARGERRDLGAARGAKPAVYAVPVQERRASCRMERHDLVECRAVEVAIRPRAPERREEALLLP